MKKNRNVFSLFLDPILKRVFSNNKQEEEKYARVRKGLSNSNHILYDMDIIDSKSSALLTHVSIMLAIVVVLLTSDVFPVDTYWRVIMIFELSAFSLVTMLLLRCVDVMGPPKRKISNNSYKVDTLYLKEINFRRAIYQSMLRLTFILTAILIATTIVKAISSIS